MHRFRRKAELLADLDRTLIGIGTHIGDLHHVVAAIAAAGGDTIALRYLGGLEVGGIAGDERGAVGQQPFHEGVGYGRVRVVTREEVGVSTGGRRGERHDIRHAAARRLERRQRNRDGNRHGEGAVTGIGGGAKPQMIGGPPRQTPPGMGARVAAAGMASVKFMRPPKGEGPSLMISIS